MKTLNTAALTLSTALALVACGGSPSPTPPPTPGNPAEVRQTLQAGTGGTVVHPAGARLTIPAGALSGSGTVVIQELPDEAAPEAFQTASKRFLVSLEGATLKGKATLELNAGKAANPVILTGDPDGTRRLRPAGNGLALQDELTTRQEGVRTFQLLHVPELDLAAPQTIVNTPYYWQDNLPWCVPTSLAMVMNQYEGLQGTVANWQLAGADNQAPDAGNSYLDILNAIGVNKNVYDYLKWDADLIPSAPFTNYLKFMINTSGRAPGLSSTTTSHAFVGVGASNTHVWLHDPSGAFSGDASIAEKLTWAEFRGIAMDQTKSTELRTLIFHKVPKSPALRRGSIVLEEGASGSLSYVRGGQVMADWQWDGSFWNSGYIWDDPSGTLPQDGAYGNRFPRTGGTGALKYLDGHFTYKARIANVTGSARNYQLYVFLQDELGNNLASKLHALNVPAYTWKTSTVQDVLSGFSIVKDGKYTIKFELLEGGEFQDTKAIHFAVGDGPLAIP